MVKTIKKLKKRRQFFRKFPTAINIELTNRCNLTCQMCPHPTLDLKTNDMDVSVLQKILKRMQPLTSSRTVFTLVGLGEPLLYPHLAEAIKTVRESCPQAAIRLNTNGTVLTKKKGEELLSVLGPRDRVLVSINSATREAYKTLMGKDLYDRVVQNTRFLLETHRRTESPVKIILQILDTRANADTLDLFRETWNPLINEKVRLYVRPLTNWGGAINLNNKNNPAQEETVPKRYPCYQLWMALAIDGDGKMYPCCEAFSARGKSELDLGLATNGDISVQYKASIKSFRKAHTTGKWNAIKDCVDCDMWKAMQNLFFKCGDIWV